MEGAYFADWSELPKDDLDRWKEEKAKRMLAWIHTLHGNEHVGAETPWWKVRIHTLSTQEKAIIIRIIGNNKSKTKRILAWIHTLHDNEHVGAENPWWKVNNLMKML